MSKKIWLIIVLIFTSAVFLFWWKAHIYRSGFDQVIVGTSSEKVTVIFGKPSTILVKETYVGNKLNPDVSEWCYYDPIIGGVDVVAFQIDKTDTVISKCRYSSP